jgi:PhnB protein
MTTRLNPYVSFATTTREAMEFYQSVLGGDLRVNTFGEYGGAPEGLEDHHVMHAQLDSPSGLTLMAADTPAGPGHGSGGSAGRTGGDATGQAAGDAMGEPGRVSLSLSGEDAEELRGYWERLSAGATVAVPLEKQMWGDEFGMLVDRFGMTWMVNITTPQ